MKKIDKIIYDMSYKSMSQKERIRWALRPKGSGQEYEKKKELIQKIKEVFGEECVQKNYIERRIGKKNYTLTNVGRYIFTNFRAPNLIVLNKDNINLILYFHYSKEIGFYGFDKNLINDVIEYINKNISEKIFFNLLFILDIPEEKVEYFCIPIFFIKNIESGISVTDYKGTIGPQYKFHFELIKNRYNLKLKKGWYEDISDFKIEINRLFNENLITRYKEEKSRYDENKFRERELLKKYSKK